MYVNKVVYDSKLENKCTVTPLDPRLLYVGPIQDKGYLYIMDTCAELYSCLSVLYVLYLAACDTARHLSILCIVGQLPTCTMQCLAASNAHYSAFCIKKHRIYTIF